MSGGLAGHDLLNPHNEPLIAVLSLWKLRREVVVILLYVHTGYGVMESGFELWPFDSRFPTPLVL